MVGVPTSRGCVGCRKQKKKCISENETPPCQRCDRLKLECIGLGERRLKFQEENHKFVVVPKDGCLAVSKTKRKSPQIISNVSNDFTTTQGYFTTISIPNNICNAITRLSAAFTYGLTSTQDTKVQLPWNFGPFIEDIPKHIGRNKALDSAVDCLNVAYDGFRASGIAKSEEGWHKYSKALLALRDVLVVPEKAYESETLAAIFLIMIFEILNGISDKGWMNHMGGAAKIFKYRDMTAPQNELEEKLIMSLRGPLVFQALFLDDKYFTEEEWISITESNLSTYSIEEEAFRYLSRLTRMFQTARRLMTQQPRDLEALVTLENRVATLRDNFNKLVAELWPRWNGMQTALRASPKSTWSQIAHMAVGRSFGMALSTQIQINFLLKGLRGGVDTDIDQENSEISRHICQFAKDVSIHRPLGTIYVPLILTMARAGAGSEVEKTHVKSVMREFSDDFYGDRISYGEQGMDWLEKFCTLSDLDLVREKPIPECDIVETTPQREKTVDEEDFMLSMLVEEAFL